MPLIPISGEVKSQPINDNNSYLENIATQANGGPKGVYATVAALEAAFPTGDQYIYLVEADGYWYYWNGAAWTQGNIYQATGVGDGTVYEISLNEELGFIRKTGLGTGIYLNALDEFMTVNNVSGWTAEIIDPVDMNVGTQQRRYTKGAGGFVQFVRGFKSTGDFGDMSNEAAFTDVSMRFNYKVTGAGQATGFCKIRLNYTDATGLSLDMEDLIYDGEEHLFTFTAPKDQSKELESFYVYFNDGATGTIVDISMADVWLGKQNDMPLTRSFEYIAEKESIDADIAAAATAYVTPLANTEATLQGNIDELSNGLKKETAVHFDAYTWLDEAEERTINNALNMTGERLTNDYTILKRGTELIHYQSATTDYNYCWLAQHFYEENRKRIIDQNLAIELTYKITEGSFELIYSPKYDGSRQNQQVDLIADGEEHTLIIKFNTVEEIFDGFGLTPVVGEDFYTFFQAGRTGGNNELYITDVKIWQGNIETDTALFSKETLDNIFNVVDVLPGEVEALDARVDGIISELDDIQAKYPAKNMRIALTGSSITWGNGRLDSSFVEFVDKHLREKLSTTIMHQEMIVNAGTEVDIDNLKFYGGSAKRLSDVNAELEFEIYGDELSVVTALERSGIGAAIVELYIDGTYHDEFSTYNEDALEESDVKLFAGDGSSVEFDLGVHFTYDHVVTIDGAPQTGGINTQGYGATFPPGDDYMIIRKYGTNPTTGETEVHHFIWFDVAPPDTSDVLVTFKYGENITYAKLTSGEITVGLDGTVESAYGDGNVAYDPADPASISSGLDFRQTDERAVKTWHFDEVKTRIFKLKVKELDPRSSGTPGVIINFATNRMHYIMNAGIGGWTAKLLYDDAALRNYHEIMKWQPDIVYIEEGTNDDWNDELQFISTKTITGLTEAEVRNLSTLWLKSCTYIGADDYTVETSVLQSVTVDYNSIVVDDTNVTFGDLKKGDIVIIGTYYWDNRQVTSRVIERFDPVTNTIHFNEALKASEFYGIKNIEELAGCEIRTKRYDYMLKYMNLCITGMYVYNPDLQVAITDMGPPNFSTRTLLGYSEKMDELADFRKCSHINTQDFVNNWQYSVLRNLQAYLTTGGNTTSDGSAEYNLVDAGGTDFNEAANVKGVKNYSVKVDGIERYGDGCHVEGNYIIGFDDATAADQLNIVDWDNKLVYKYTPTKLVFTSNIPAIGATITIKASSQKWSNDETHPNDYGMVVMAKPMNGSLENMTAIVDADKSKGDIKLASGWYPITAAQTVQIVNEAGYNAEVTIEFATTDTPNEENIQKASIVTTGSEVYGLYVSSIEDYTIDVIAGANGPHAGLGAGGVLETEASGYFRIVYI